MKTKLIFTIIFLAISIISFGQELYDKTHPYGEYRKGWALVVKDGLYGFITSAGIEIVKPKYESITKGTTLKGIIDGNEEDIKQ